ncbi:short chain dehydrogenase [Ceratobasidium sp. AG-Ba]|nr:short chain dehydrogenase [Ceratobasidium sp. AG-Ba]
MPYSETAHYHVVANFLSTLSNIRGGLGTLFVPFLPAMRLPDVDLRGKQAIVTGANSGIGFESAKALAKMGARVILACRNAERGEQARREIAEAVPGGVAEVEIMDLSNLESVREFITRWGARDLKRVDILINNAGSVSNVLTKTRDGLEYAYQSNHIAHVLLTLLLINREYLAPDARVINVSSIAFFSCPPMDEHNTDSSDIVVNHREGDNLPWDAIVKIYDRSKASQAVWSMTLQRKLASSEKWKDTVVQVCHPGIVQSSMINQPTGLGGATGSGVDAFKRFVGMVEEPGQPDLRGLYWDR